MLGIVVCRNITQIDLSESQMKFCSYNGFQMPIGHIFKKYIKTWTSLKVIWSKQLFWSALFPAQSCTAVE